MTSTPVSRTVDVRGPVNVIDWGGEGPPLLMIHGLGGSSLDWLAVAPGLTRRHRVLALDLPGFGRTPRGHRSASVGSAAQLVADAAAALGLPRVTLVGCSMGGLVALLAANRSPDLVERLVLVGPALPTAAGSLPNRIVLAGVMVSSLPRVGGRIVRERTRLLGPDGLVDQTLSICCVDPARVDPAQRRAFVELAMERRRTRPDASEAYSQAARSLVLTLVGPVGRVVARRVRLPVLVVHGRRDRLVNVRAAMAFCAGRPERTLRVIEDCGHIPMVEMPGPFLEAVTPWLAGPGRRAA